MNTKSRLAALEAIATTKAQQATQGAPSTPATRAQALAELDTWRAEMSDDAAMLETMHEYSAHRLQLTAPGRHTRTHSRA